MVPIGGSRALPKHTYAALWWTDEKSKMAEIGLGSRHKIGPGDRFLIQTGNIGMTWVLTITKVETDRSVGSLEPTHVSPALRFPTPGSYAALIRKN